MAKWRKQFDQWKEAKSPVRKTEVEALLKRVFAERLRLAEGTSHEFILSVPELQDTPEFQLGECCVPVDGGQQVKGHWLKRAYRVAIELKLYPPAQEVEDTKDTNGTEEDHEQDNHEGDVG